MVPTVSIDQVIDRLDSTREGTTCVVPIIMIRPEVLSLFDNPRYIHDLMDFYDLRTGGIPFFLPGYYHADPGKLLQIPDFTPRGAKSFHIGRLGDVCYSTKYFTQCISEIEEKNSNYHYVGATELILVQFYPKTAAQSATLDFPNMAVYDLSQLYVNGGSVLGGLHKIERFLGEAFRYIKDKEPYNELVKGLSAHYKIMADR